MPRTRTTESRRRQIVDAAVAVIARVGWAGASIDEITAEAGVSRGLVSYHFRDKNELLSAVLERVREGFNDSVEAAIAETSDPVEGLRIASRVSLYAAVKDPVPYRIFLYFFANGASEPDLAEQIRELYAGFREAVAKTIRGCQKRGYFDPELDPEAAAARHIGAITGLALQHLLDPGAFPFDEAARQAEDMLMASLIGPVGSPQATRLSGTSPS
ncbi:MAG: TetR/AcrR family transcriptional regulator [Dehalococcoidia bacterium]|nr:TetR/AcrR family transcriptional regulator [Dehalococcoidia bacterium]